MTWTLSAYIARRFLMALLASLVVVFLIILILNLVEILRRGVGDGFPALLALAALKSPSVALVVSPFVVMLAALACFARLARGSELVVLRAAGVSVWAQLAPAALVGVAFGVLSFAALNPIAAATAFRFETLERRAGGGEASSLSVSPEGLWLRESAGAGKVVIRAGHADGRATELLDVTMFLFDGDDMLDGRIDAAAARLEPGGWVLRQAVLRRLAADDAGPGSAPAARFERLERPTSLTSAQILDSLAPPETMSFWELPGFIATLEAAGFSARRHRMHWHGQLSLPALFAAMAMIGGAFAMRPARFGGLGGMALGAVLTGFAFYFISDVARALGASGAAPVALAAWAPPLAAALIAAGLLIHLEEG